MWRWDQGRLGYFNYDTLQKIASILKKYDGVEINANIEASFRTDLMISTGLPFAPQSYTVKRNYKRVFQCSLLASYSGNTLIATDICKSIALTSEEPLTVDEYMSLFAQRFRYPFPAFDNYGELEDVVYPVLAIVKLLIARQLLGKSPSLTIEDIAFYLIGTGCTGMEDIEFYSNLHPQLLTLSDIEIRQMRELLIFISQFSFLQFYNGALYLEDLSDSAIEVMLSTTLQPFIKKLNFDKDYAIIELGRLDDAIVLPEIELSSTSVEDIEFIEGKRVRKEHIRIERSSLLRRYYLYEHERPICFACEMDTSIKYPWTDYLLEIHHLLPLSSAIKISTKGTSLDDVVGLCPTCHRAIHSFYKKWLNENNVKDFKSKAEAKDVFLMAKREIAQTCDRSH